VKVPPYLIPRAHTVIPGATLANQTLINATHDPGSATSRQPRYHGPAHILCGERDRLAAAGEYHGPVMARRSPQLQAPTELTEWLHDSCRSQLPSHEMLAT